jgi:beta-glucosidase
VNPVLHPNTVAFIRQLKTFQKPIVLVISAGRPLVLTEVVDHVDGLVYAYFLGTEAGQSIVDTLLGKNAPSAKLTMSFPRHVGQIPIMYNHLNTGRPFLGTSFTYTSHYIDESNLPLFPFGHGLSYAKFHVSAITEDRSQPVYTLQVTVENTSDVDSALILPVYMQAATTAVATPNAQLVAMKRIFLKAHAQQTVALPVESAWLRYLDSQYQWQPITGPITLTLVVDGKSYAITKES